MRKILLAATVCTAFGIVAVNALAWPSAAQAAFCSEFNSTTGNNCGTQIKTVVVSNPDNGSFAHVPGTDAGILNNGDADAEGMYPGNDSNSQALVTSIIGINTFLAKHDLDEDEFEEPHGKVTSSNGGSSGTFSYDADDNYVPKWLIVKGGNGFTVWDISSALTLTAGVYSGFWSTEGLLNNGGNQPDVSHLSVYGAIVPLPASVLFFGSALFGLTWLRRQNQQGVNSGTL